MTNLFTLDDLRAAADRKFAPLKIELSDGSVVVLRNLLRMSDKERATALSALDDPRYDVWVISCNRA